MAVVNKVTGSGASAYQGAHPDGSQVVNIKNIRVVIYPNPSGKRWIAQGFEIDYISQGKNVADVKRTFENGLTATIDQYIKAHGDINRLLKPAPMKVCLTALEHAFGTSGSIVAKFSQLSVHNVNVKIEYLQLPYAA